MALSRVDAKAQVERLVVKFSRLDAHHRKAYNEAATRQEFVLPLFRALGWNTEDTREVSPEEQVSRGYVDFSFRLGGIPRFFLETKRIPADLDDPRWAQQAINYAWLKGVTWAVLSDFEGLKVLNAEWQETVPARAIFKDLHWQQYLDRFDDLWLLSRPAIEEGQLDREAEAVGRKVKKTPVSRLLFADLTEWRRALFQSLRQYNRARPIEQIDEAVQRILDRLIFIRTCEDRGIESYRLQPMLREWRDQGRKKDLVTELNALFREFDQVYDSRLFAPHLGEQLTSEPAPYEKVIEGLYEVPGSYGRYDFNAIDADVLGTIYEQYLGHRAQDPKGEQVVDKRAKRKAQGIYYTPQFVVRYIVQQTLGRFLEQADYGQARQVKVLDMACGSGSFLIEAFSVLDRYFAKVRGQDAPLSQSVLGEGPGVRVAGDLHDFARRMEILSNNLYGVDLDAQAVEIAQLNLLLKAVNQRGRLPTLDNIRQGNSLVSGTPAELEAAFGPDWRDKRPFNWEEQFPAIMGRGGFDVVVGNPPYVRPHNLSPEIKAFLWDHFGTFVGKSDLYCCFIQRAIDLAKPGGLIAFVVSDGWLRLDSFQAVRRYILSKCKAIQLVDLPDKVFEDASVKTCIFVFRKESSPAERSNHRVHVLALAPSTTTPTTLREIPQVVFEHTRRNVFDLSLSSEVQSFKQKMDSGSLMLAELVDIRFGLKTGDDAKFIHTTAKTRQHKPLLRGENIHRYELEFAGEYVWYVPDKMREHRATARPGEPERFEQPKILVRDTGQRFECTLDLNNYYVKDVLVLTRKQDCPYSLHYVAGLLNSKAMRFYYETTFPTLHVQHSELAPLPIRRINFDNPMDIAQHDRIVALVEEMLPLQKEHAQAEALKEDRRHDLARQIKQLDAQIDALVYDLYGLTEKEIAVVEGTVTGP